ncbi:transformer 2 beta, partial [Nowakowskiella sp. JEL0078]
MQLKRYLKLQSPPASCVLGVFGLSLYTNERDLEDLFSQFGGTEKIIIIYDKSTQRSRGYAFITMKTTEKAIDARNTLNGSILREREMRVDFSWTERPHPRGSYPPFRRSRSPPSRRSRSPYRTLRHRSPDLYRGDREYLSSTSRDR